MGFRGIIGGEPDWVYCRSFRLYDLDYKGCMSCMACKVKGRASNVCKLSYNDYSMTAPKRMPVLLVETMNGTPERNNSNGYGSMAYSISAALGKPEHLVAYNTYQVNNYDRYELASFSQEAKRQWRETHWEEDLRKAFDAGYQLAGRITGLS